MSTKSTNANAGMFETATRKKLRFPSPRGALSVEQLWDVPLRSTKDDFNLNTVAQAVDKELKALAASNFVEDAKPVAFDATQMAFDIVMFVIGTLKDEEAAAKSKAERKVEVNKLIEALAKKQDDALGDMTEAQIRKRLEALSET
jgi:hypothetical protein